MSRPQSGFTLVELAIVLMIIGLLIGGILKGQELISNARANTVMRQVKSYEAAIITFQDSYGALPGDITTPSTRIPNCTATPCSTAGNGNGMIGTTATSITASPYLIGGTELSRFWVHLAKANLISGINADYTGTPATYGVDYPSTPFGGGFEISHLTPSSGEPIPHTGHHLFTMSQESMAASESIQNGNNVFPVAIAAQIDRKMDDGKPVTGNVSHGGIAECITGTPSEYNTASSGKCNLLFYLGY